MRQAMTKVERLIADLKNAGTRISVSPTTGKFTSYVDWECLARHVRRRERAAKCCCGNPNAPGVVHRERVPCYYEDGEPAAKCATCGGTGRVPDKVVASHVSGRGHENSVIYKPCPSCSAKDGGK